MNDNILISCKWTREDLEDYIRSRGGEPDDNTVEDLAGKISERLDSVLDELMLNIRMKPAMEPYASLCKLGVTLPLCNNCERYRNGSCCSCHWSQRKGYIFHAAGEGNFHAAKRPLLYSNISCNI